MRAHEFADQGAAGVVLYAEDTGRYGLQQRSNSINDGGLWAAWGGGREPGETLEECARRELMEESGYRGPIELQRLGANSRYVTFLGTVPHEFKPRPDPEWQDFCWVEAGDWPSPMHPGVAAALKNIPIDEGVKSRLAQAALAGGLALGAGGANAMDWKDAAMTGAMFVPGIGPAVKAYNVGKSLYQAGTAAKQYRDLDKELTALAAKNKAENPRGPTTVTYDPNNADKFEPVDENFADGKVRGKSRPGRVKRAGASCDGSVSSLRAKAKKYGGEKGKMYHWCANMKGGRKKVSEVNVDTAYDPEELTVKQTFIDYFTNKGYKMLGEGRDQIAFLTPRQTVLKVLGFGNEQREQAVEDYVEFFLQHQNNPYYPKIYNTQRFDYQGDSHFMYETEYLEYVANEEDTLDWLETYMDLLARGGPEQAQQFIEEEGIPNELTLKDVQGLTQATREIQENLAGYVVDLSNIENIRRRKNRHLVIVDPISL